MIFLVNDMKYIHYLFWSKTKFPKARFSFFLHIFKYLGPNGLFYFRVYLITRYVTPTEINHKMYEIKIRIK